MAGFLFFSFFKLNFRGLDSHIFSAVFHSRVFSWEVCFFADPDVFVFVVQTVEPREVEEAHGDGGHTESSAGGGGRG